MTPTRAAASLLAAAVSGWAIACGAPGAAPPLPMTPTATAALAPPTSCARAEPDADRDGMSDACEAALSMAFAPVLMQQRDDCAWREDSAAARIPGGYHHAVRPAGAGRARIAYLPGYLRDCGWSGAKCLLPGVDCRPHAGDSEAIIVEIAYDEARAVWLPSAIFLSAHCFAGGAPSCRWYERAELGGLEWRGTAPVVWVASGRHANYPSRDACDRGHNRLDTCDGEAAAVPFPARADRNVGSADVPIDGDGCVPAPSELPLSLVASGATECFWSDRPFRGWQGDAHAGVTPYRRYLDLMEAR